MRYYLDEEFIDDAKTIDLISIGIVAEDGRELYLQSCEFNHRAASKWVQENVFPGLSTCPYEHGPRFYDAYHVGVALHMHYPKGQCTPGHYVGEKRDNMMVQIIDGHLPKCPWRSRSQIKAEILAFMDIEKYGYPELIGWCCSYDFVAFCQLFGTMMDVPRFIPHYMKDVQYLLDEYGLTDDMLPKQEGTAHNALSDAKYIRQLWESLLRYDAEMRQ